MDVLVSGTSECRWGVAAACGMLVSRSSSAGSTRDSEDQFCSVQHSDKAPRGYL